VCRPGFFCAALPAFLRGFSLMVTTVKCPTCQRPVVWSTDNAWRPFCSERCKQVDLGAWAAERFAIPGEPAEQDDIPPARHD
jgi:endogenous inhibitor of DNA gyrase (YacG/DUF329 family)